MPPRKFIREIKLVITLKSSGEQLVWTTSGDRGGLRISYRIEKTLWSNPNMSNIVIYNLNREHRNMLRSKDNLLELFVGYETESLDLLATGRIVNCSHDRNGPEIQSKIMMFDGLGTFSNSVVQKYIGSRSLTNVVFDLASNLSGVKITKTRIKVPNVKIGSRGRCFNGRVADHLKHLSEQYGFNWSVQDGVFQALEDDESFDITHILSSTNKNLYKVVPVLGGIEQADIGAEITASVEPAILPGHKVNVQSSVDPGLNGVYVVHNVSYNGDSHSESQEMSITSYRGAPGTEGIFLR